MANLFYKYKRAARQKKEALHSLIAGLFLFALLYAITKFFSVPLCPIQNIFGKPCFGCGLTRGFIAILSFDLKGAVAHHVLSIPLFIGIVIYAVLCISDIWLDRNDLARIAKRLKNRYMPVVYFLLLVLTVYLNRLV